MFSLQCACAEKLKYIVKEGDNLSSIAAKFIDSPIYGKEGSLRKILLMNSVIQNQNMINPGMSISLPLELQPKQGRSIGLWRELDLKVNIGIIGIIATDKFSSVEQRVVSNLGFGAGLFYRFYEGELLNTSIEVGFNRYFLRTSDELELEQTSGWIFMGGLTFDYQVFERAKIRAGVYQEQFYIVGSTGGEDLYVDLISPYKALLGLEYAAYKFSIANLLIDSQYFFITGTEDFGFSQGDAFEVGLSLQRKENKLRLFYRTINLDFTASEQVSKLLGTELRFHF